ncbi:MAG: MaoC family dehydratase [Faecalibacterium sp.]
MEHLLRHYTLDALSVGMTEQFKMEITEPMMTQFFAITGDCSPIHVNAAYAAKRGYGGCVVYGMLSASMVSTLAGVYLPGEHCLLHQVNSKFVKPVFVGDTLTITGKISEINETFSTITVKFTITNQHGKKVTRGSYTAGLADA